MSSSRTYQCLSCRLKSVVDQSTRSVRRSFNTTSVNHARNRGGRGTRFPNIKAADMGLPEARQTEIDSLASHLRPYTEHEKKLLAMKYTPEQMRAIEEGEKAVSSGDLVTQGRFRTDPMRIEYVDDFATVRPVIDQPLSALEKALDTPLIPGTQAVDEAAVALQKARLAPKPAEDEEDPRMLRLSQQTGMTIQEIRRLKTKTLVTHRVVNQTRMGKIQSMYFLAVAGNGEGMVGIGEGKAAEFEDGNRQATLNAIRNMKPIPRYEERTIFGESQGKVGASVVQLSARPPGFGNRCQHLIFELARAAGISDLAARTPRSRNKMNVVKAAFQALTNQRLPEDVSRARSLKLVDVRGVYYGGSVH